LKIEVYDCEDGDWTEIRVDGVEFYSGHEIPDFTWIELLRKAGAEVVEEEVSADFF
jgi:hypothetical protein